MNKVVVTGGSGKAAPAFSGGSNRQKGFGMPSHQCQPFTPSLPAGTSAGRRRFRSVSRATRPPQPSGYQIGMIRPAGALYRAPVQPQRTAVGSSTGRKPSPSFSTTTSSVAGG